MSRTGKQKSPSDTRKRVEGVTPSERTRVIVLSQVVTIVALLVLWAMLRARRSNA